jgi:hypothetical protein
LEEACTAVGLSPVQGLLPLERLIETDRAVFVLSEQNEMKERRSEMRIGRRRRRRIRIRKENMRSRTVSPVILL